jgi:2-polyprenyl-3-methyl-5-hydroxy-6-metoxy-1,4-benzoquinol methylase
MKLAESQFTTDTVSLLAPPAGKPFTRQPGESSAGVSSSDRESSQVENIPSVETSPGSQAGGCTHPAHHLLALFPAQDFITDHDFNVALCAGCGLAVTSPQPSANEIARYYPSGYYGALSERRFPKIVELLQQALYGQRVAKVEWAAEGTRGRVLDVGCGRGLLLQEFRRRGWEVQGTELSEEAANHARQVLKLPVETGSLETIGFPANHFDAVTLWHVLEHVTEPSALLSEINRILKPGGVLLVSVPNFGSFEARCFQDKWFHLDVPRHVTHFTQTMLRKALGQTGFQDRHWSGFAPEYDAFSFVQSALNRCGLRHNLLYDLLRGKRAKVLATGKTPKWQLPATIVLGALFGLIALPMTLWAGLFKQGATMTVLAIKRAEAPVRVKSFLEAIAAAIPSRWARTS